MTEPTLTEALAAKGFTAGPSEFPNHKQIFNAEGKIVLEATATYVWKWLNESGARAKRKSK